MRLRGLGTRRRPCASRLNTHMEAPCPLVGQKGSGGGGRSAGSLRVLEEATAETTAPPVQLWTVISSVLFLYILMLTYISLHLFQIRPPCFI